MTEEFNPYSEPSSEPVTPPSPKRRRLGRAPRAALAGGVIVGLAVGGTGVGLAVASATSGSTSTTAPASSSSTTTPSSGTHSGHFGGRGGFGPGMGALGFGGLGGGVVHGVFTVKSGSGYKTEEVQTGTVSSVSSSSITVASADGYNHTYSVVSATVVDAQAGGISSVAAKDQITIEATTSNGTDTATNITDLTKLKASRTSFGFPGPGGGPNGAAWGGRGQVPSGSGSGSGPAGTAPGGSAPSSSSSTGAASA